MNELEDGAFVLGIQNSICEGFLFDFFYCFLALELEFCVWEGVWVGLRFYFGLWFFKTLLIIFSNVFCRVDL